MRVIVAEKPELGRAIADALGGGRRADGHIVCRDVAVTWCFGHLLELTDPEDHDPETGRWDAARLPLAWPATHKPIEGKQDQIALIRRLVRGAKVVVHAGDPDEEGQLLVDLVLHHVGNRAPVKRLLINDLNVDVVRRALRSMRDNAEFVGLYRAALGRSIADQRYGYNLTRAYTLAARRLGADGVLSVGRVQTPILGLVVRRDRQRENHEKQKYYELDATFAEGGDGGAADAADAEVGTGPRSLRARYVPAKDIPVDDKGRPNERDALEKVAADVDGRTGLVVTARTDARTTPPPLPYDLLTLQADASRKFGIPPDRTLALTQGLRERHRLITYNRSDCRYLPDEQHGDAPGVLSAVAATAPVLAHAVDAADAAVKGRAYDSRHVTAHHAIVPTAARANLAALSDGEAKVYQLVARAFVAQFHPPERYRATTVEIDVAGHGGTVHRFRATGRVQVDPGWKRLYRNDRGGEASAALEGAALDLEWVSEGATMDCTDPSVSERETQPPPAYTMATLLKDLASVAKYVTDPRVKALLLAKDADKKGERGGIGTPATRSAIIATLLRRGYVEERGKQVLSTTFGRDFHDALPASATAPDMTALWHEQQQEIRRGDTTLEAFLEGVAGHVRQEVARAGTAEIRVAATGPACPACAKGVMKRRQGSKGEFMGCSRYPDCRHTADVPGAPDAKDRPAAGRAKGSRTRRAPVPEARTKRASATGASSKTAAKRTSARRPASKKAASKVAAKRPPGRTRSRPKGDDASR